MTKAFAELGISESILEALTAMGFSEPTEVQRQGIPPILKGRDVIVQSKTGSGKTAVFGVSMLELTDPSQPGPQGLILTPTRELAVQVDRDLSQMAKHVPHTTTAVYGQHSMQGEIKELRQGATIVTGTPGRVFDHIQQKNLRTQSIRFLVLDEADRMLDMGFIDQVVRIIKTLPKNRVTLLFSATMPAEVHRIVSQYMKDPLTIAMESSTMTVDSIEQSYVRVERNEKRRQLDHIFLADQPETAMVFCNTRHEVDRVQRFLQQKGYRSASLHGDIAQGKRIQTIDQFKKGHYQVLVATDVAARGIHIDDLSLVVNYDVPQEKDSYVHRIGRTGRTGASGRAITLVTSEDIMTLYEIEEHIGALIPEGDLPKEKDIVAAKKKRDLELRQRPASHVAKPASSKSDQPKPRARQHSKTASQTRSRSSQRSPGRVETGRNTVPKSQNTANEPARQEISKETTKTPNRSDNTVTPKAETRERPVATPTPTKDHSGSTPKRDTAKEKGLLGRIVSKIRGQ